MSDDKLRVKLIERTQEALIRQYDSEYDAANVNLGDFREQAEQIIDALLPVVRAALTEAWDAGVNDEASAECSLNPWREVD